MSRLAATLRLDSRLQARNKIYLVVVVASFALAWVLRTIVEPQQLRFFMPLVALLGVNATGFFIVAMILLVERDEGTLDVVLVSPLRPAEYLASKVITLTGLALAESLLIAAVAYGLDFAVPWLVLAVLQKAALAVALGVVVGVRYRSLTRLVLPMIAILVALDLPALWYLGLVESPLLLLVPSGPSVVLAKAAFAEVPPLQLVFAGLYGAASVVVALRWATRSIERWVLRGGVA